MPFFILGFAVGALVTKAVRKLFNSDLSADDSKSDEKPTVDLDGHFGQDLPDSTSVQVYRGSVTAATRMEEIRATRTNTHFVREVGLRLITSAFSDPCAHICRFPNKFRNCWMNATLQATLNLQVVRNKLTHQPAEFFTHMSQTQIFAGLFLKALNNPGINFRAAEIYDALEELSDKVPELELLQNNDPVDLLCPLLEWLDQCGVQTTLQMKELSSCKDCSLSTCRTSNEGSVYFLPQPCKSDTTFSLLKRGIGEGTGQCIACDSTVERNWVCNDPDILTLYVPRPAEGESGTESLSPSRFLEIPVDEDKTQIYSLSSVICRRGYTARTGHFWSYLFSDHRTIRAKDSQISLEKAIPKDIYKSGMVYFYEKVQMQE